MKSIVPPNACDKDSDPSETYHACICLRDQVFGPVTSGSTFLVIPYSFLKILDFDKAFRTFVFLFLKDTIICNKGRDNRVKRAGTSFRIRNIQDINFITKMPLRTFSEESSG